MTCYTKKDPQELDVALELIKKIKDSEVAEEEV